MSLSRAAAKKAKSRRINLGRELIRLEAGTAIAAPTWSVTIPARPHFLGSKKTRRRAEARARQSARRNMKQGKSLLDVQRCLHLYFYGSKREISRLLAIYSLAVCCVASCRTGYTPGANEACLKVVLCPSRETSLHLLSLLARSSNPKISKSLLRRQWAEHPAGIVHHIRKGPLRHSQIGLALFQSSTSLH